MDELESEKGMWEKMVYYWYWREREEKESM